MNKYNIHSECQHGFHKNRSCDTQLQHGFEGLSDMFNNGDPYDIIHFDLKKAFD